MKNLVPKGAISVRANAAFSALVSALPSTRQKLADAQLAEMTKSLRAIVAGSLALLLFEATLPPKERRLTSLHRALRKQHKHPGELQKNHAAWPILQSMLRELAPDSPLSHAADFPSFSRENAPFDDGAIAAALDLLAPPKAPLVLADVGAAFESLLASSIDKTTTGAWLVKLHEERRRAGAHYTSPALARCVVERTLAPLVNSRTNILDARVCDPAMGAGAFLVAACEYLAERAGAQKDARSLIARSCLYGVDQDPHAALFARLSLWLFCGAKEHFSDFPKEHFPSGNSLQNDDPSHASPTFAWERQFPEVMSRNGFDAFVGNPPWVSYAGRAAQPLPKNVRAQYANYEAFAGYRNLQSLFIERAASLLRAGGRLGFILPTSMSDLSGYEPSRRAHDRLCVTDSSLPDFEGGGFEGVFQPCMGLFSTKRGEKVALEKTGAWPLERNDLDAEARALLAMLSSLPKLPPEAFGERGYQTSGPETKQLRKKIGPSKTHTFALRCGSDIEPFRRKKPSYYADPKSLLGRVRSPEEWAAVPVLIRQTARVPMATLSDGAAFRNSLLAGFSIPPFSPQFLVAYLNSSPVRYYHYMQHRDARQGMPQLKISHLRALPRPNVASPSFPSISALGARLSSRDDGIDESEQAELDELVSDVLGIDDTGRKLIASWRRDASLGLRVRVTNVS